MSWTEEEDGLQRSEGGKQARQQADLIVGCSETTTNVFIVQNLNLESEILLKVLDDHDQERQLDAERLLGISRACDKIGAHLQTGIRGGGTTSRTTLNYKRMVSIKVVIKAHVGAHNLQHTAVDVLVSDALDVAISNLLVPNLQRLGSVKTSGHASWCAAIYAPAYPMLYKIDKNPDWNVFLNMAQEANLTDKSGEQQKVRIHKNPFPTLISVIKPAPLFTILHSMLAVIA